MKQWLYIYFLGAIYIMKPMWRDADCQYFEDPQINFKPFLVEWVNRGSYNTSGCVNDVINCWEVIKGEVICSNYKYYETICGLSRENCQDQIGDFDTPKYFTLYESYCKTYYEDHIT